MRNWLIGSGIIVILMLVLTLGYKCGIRHAMNDSTVAVYLDGIVEIRLDGHIYEHTAF